MLAYNGVISVARGGQVASFVEAVGRAVDPTLI
jgi:hypothetical protein